MTSITVQNSQTVFKQRRQRVVACGCKVEQRGVCLFQTTKLSGLSALLT